MEGGACTHSTISLHKSTELFLLTLNYIRHNRNALANGEGIFRFVDTMRFLKTEHSKEFSVCLLQPKRENGDKAKRVLKGEDLKGKGRRVTAQDVFYLCFNKLFS